MEKVSDMMRLHSLRPDPARGIASSAWVAVKVQAMGRPAAKGTKVKRRVPAGAFGLGLRRADAVDSTIAEARI